MRGGSSEVHAIYTRNEGRGHKNHTGYRKNLYNLVLLNVYKGHKRILEIL